MCQPLATRANLIKSLHFKRNMMRLDIIGSSQRNNMMVCVFCSTIATHEGGNQVVRTIFVNTVRSEQSKTVGIPCHAGSNILHLQRNVTQAQHDRWTRRRAPTMVHTDLDSTKVKWLRSFYFQHWKCLAQRQQVELITVWIAHGN